MRKKNKKLKEKRKEKDRRRLKRKRDVNRINKYNNMWILWRNEWEHRIFNEREWKNKEIRKKDKEI